MSFVKFELCHYLLKCYNYPVCSLLPLRDSNYMYIRLFIVSYICLALFDKSISFVLVPGQVFSPGLSSSSQTHFLGMYNLLLSLLSFSWLSLWQIFTHFIWWLAATDITWICAEYIILTSQKQVKFEWVNFAINSNFDYTLF